MTTHRRNFLKNLSAGPFFMVAGNSGLAETVPGVTPGKGMTRREVTWPSFYTHRILKTDILVAGGGLAGVCAAIAAARNGANVILVQNRSRLGGNSSSEIRMHALGANSPQQLRNWRETGIIEELKLTDSASNLQRSFEMWDLLLYDKVVSEKNISLMLDTFVVDATVENELLKSVEAISPLVEERYTISARFFLDCTGDAGLAVAAGAQLMRGRESQSRFGESLAPVSADLKTMGNTLLFFSRKHEHPMPFRPPAWCRTFAEKDFTFRPIHSWEYGYWWVEWGGELDTIKDNQKIRHELMRITLGVWDYIKNSGAFPTSREWALEWVGMLPGKRESRRIIGDHVLIQQNLEQCEEFPDRVAYGGWPIDDHPPGGIDRTDIEPTRYVNFNKPYHVPLRSLYSINRSNLLMAGRNISASHVAFASTRVMATCATLGQAAGTAAAFCLRSKSLPREVVRDASRLRQLQQWLLKDDQSMIGFRNEDGADLAKSAKVKGSGETIDGKASNLLDGVTRNILDGQTHQWQAPLGESKPWVELTWPEPVQIGAVQITFDSGLNRLLYITGQDHEYRSQIRGAQPETVAEYEVEGWIDNSWKLIAANRNNFLRLVRHTFQPVFTTRLRCKILRTNGDRLARIFEIRCYA
jgi:hypothetical protein